MNELILHVGLHKTGTTSIQYSLSASADALAPDNYHYLNISNIEGVPIKNHSIIFKSLFMERPETFHINITRNWDPAIVNRHYLQALERELSANREKRLIISGEGISVLKKQELADLVDYFSSYHIRTILYVRNPYHAMCSRLQQAVRSGVVEPLEDITSSYINSQSKAIKSIQKVLPAPEVYSFNDAQKKDGVVIHFASLLGIKDPARITIVRKNEGLSHKLVRLGEYINRYEPSIKDGRANKVRQGFDLIRQEFSTGAFLLRETEGRAVRELLKREADEIHSLTGIEFDNDMEYAEEPALTPDEVITLVKNARPLNFTLRKLIWSYIKEHSNAGVPKKSRLFSLLERPRV